AKPVDDLGSKQFGQAQLTLIMEIMHAIWRDHPHARLAYTIGYAEHKQDPAYYKVIRHMSDPRFEWMEARDSWEFPGPGGENLPASYFSRQVMRWRQHYTRPLENLIKDANRIATSGFYGYITSFEPGFSTGSYYKSIPYPTDILPYVLTGFVFREATWEPTLTVNQMHQRVHDRFFGREAPRDLAEDFWSLREIIRKAASSKEMTADLREALTRIEQHVEKARTSADPKTLDALALMTRAINDTQDHFRAKKQRNNQ
ncbi:unnamed protein product, partial [marine sediment metagenome]